MLLRLSIFLISFSALGFEILLSRLFSIVQWHHFAYMIISLALLGFGASGTFLTLLQKRFSAHWARAYLTQALLFGISILLSFSLAQGVPFNPLEILWDFRQSFYLFAVYLILAFPFFFAANCIGLVFIRFKDQIGSFYSFDLIGAGMGALGILLALFAFYPTTCLTILSILALLGVVLAILDPKLGVRLPWVLLPMAGILLVSPWGPFSGDQLRLSEYKGLSMALEVPDTQVIHQNTSPLGWITVVQSPTIPFRHTPGLSLQNQKEPPEQLAVFTDGDSLSPIARFRGNREELEYLDYLSSALPYHLLADPRVLILGGGGGSEILLAKYHGARRIDVVELNGQILELLKNLFREFSGNLFDKKTVFPIVSEARSFVRQGKKEGNQYDLVQISLLDAFGAATAGLYSLSENYLYTVEALSDYLNQIKPEGFLAITRWLKLPPRDSLKLLLTAMEALQGMGVSNPGEHLALIRSWKTVTLLVKKNPLTPADIGTLKKFSKDRSFDLAYYPGMSPNEANQFNQLAQPYFYLGAQALLGSGQNQFLKDYKFNISPARDDRPFFFHFLKWGTFPEIFSLRGKGGIPLLEWGYPVLVAVLIQALFASLVFILLPLFWLRRQSGKLRGRLSVLIYFFSLGLAFLFIEMVFMQKFILFLGHPLYALGVVLSGFLIFAGLGSGFSKKFSKGEYGKSILLSVGAILILGFSYQFLLPGIFKLGLNLSENLKVIISVLLIAPLAFFMGMPFPLGLTFLGERQPVTLPWAWGINGCASVLSSVLATLLAVHFGFSLVIFLALGLYLLAYLSFRGMETSL